MKIQDLWRKLHNLEQVVREKAHVRPRGCQCNLCEPEDYYYCRGCGYFKAYCLGQDDDYFELCDLCWAKVQKLKHEI